MEYSTFGRHVAVDAWGISFDLLNHVKQLSEWMVAGAEEAGVTVLSVHHKQFQPQGVTVLLMLSESHFSIHTYPEKGFAALDCYTCGQTIDPLQAIHLMLDRLQPTRTYMKILHRGLGEIQVETPSYRQGESEVSMVD